jgi:putative MATE family efflux protein
MENFSRAAGEESQVDDASPRQTWVTELTHEPKKEFNGIFGLEPELLRRIVRLGWPVVFGMLTQTAINTVDVILVGRLSDEIAVPGTAAILCSIVVLWAFGGFLSAISVGTQAFAARRFSEGHLEKSGQVLLNSVVISVVASIAMYALSRECLPYLLNFVAPSPSVREIALSFSNIRFLALPAIAITASYKSFYDGIGRVRVHMGCAILMNIVNIWCNMYLIFGGKIFGYTIAPQYVDGAAWGSVIASYGGVLVIMLWTLRKQDRTQFKIYRLSNVDWKVMKAIVSLSIWSALATVILMAGVGLFNHIVGMIDIKDGTPDINSASASIIIHVMMLVFMCALAFGTSTATLVSQSMGAKKQNLAERYGWQSALLAFYSMLSLGAVLFLFPRPIMQFFLPSELRSAGDLKELVVEHALPSLRICAILLSPVSAAALVLTQALYGAGSTLYVMCVEFMLHFGVLVPFSWLLSLHFGFGLIGCWIAAILYAFGLLLATGIQFRRGKWKEQAL